MFTGLGDSGRSLRDPILHYYFCLSEKKTTRGHLLPGNQLNPDDQVFIFSSKDLKYFIL